MTYMFFTVLPFMVCVFWTTVFLLEWRTAHHAKRWLTIFMAISAALYFCHAVFFNHKDSIMPLANSIYVFCNLSVFPLYYLYVCRLTDSHSITPARCALLLPAVIVGLWATMLYWFFPDADMAQHLRMEAAKVIFFLQLLPICYLGVKRLKEFDNRIENFYSNTDIRSVKQTQRMMLMLFVCSLCSAIANHIGREYFYHNLTQLIAPSLVFGILLFCVGYVGQKQTFCVDDLEKAELEDNNKETSIADVDNMLGFKKQSVLSTNDAETSQAENMNAKMIELLDRLMKEERLYLQSDLRLPDVARRLGVGRTTLSSLINQSLGMSFSDYVNTFRVHHAQNIIANSAQPCTMSIIQISESSGFTTEGSFYRTFRKHVGMTPKQWSKKIK